MTPIQQMFLGAGGKVDPVYLDDVFSTYVYPGEADAYSVQTIVNNLDLATEGGMVWIKNRSASQASVIGDSVRGNNKYLSSSSLSGSLTSDARFKELTTTGFKIGGDSDTGNYSGNDYVSWSFRKAKGFFDVVAWDGNQTGSSTRTLNHSLGSIPGQIIIKRTDGNSNWWVYHKSLPNDKILFLNETNAQGNGGYQYYQSVSSTGLTVGTELNESGRSYIAYVFAGGESTAATARNVALDGTGDYLSVGSSTDFSFGTGDFTIEGWFRKDDLTQGGFWQIGSSVGGLSGGTAPACAWTASSWQMYGGGDNTNSSPAVVANQWFHVAQVRLSGVTTMYVNGQAVITRADTSNYAGTYLAIGGYYSASYLHEGEVSNFRVVKGTAVYTSSFRPPTEPLTSITNTVLLCCNNSSTTGKTTGGTITANGDPTASTDSPFDDPAGFKFGDAKENIIKCGSYIGNGNANGPEINLGFEPQWIMLKRTDSTDNWAMYDAMRGIATNGTDNQLRADQSAAEHTTGTTIAVTSTGFKLETSGSEVNANNGEYIYICIRRPDPLVQKPQLATDVFAMDYGNSRSAIPNFDSGFPVDFAWAKTTASANHWYTSARLIQKKELLLDAAASEGTGNNKVFDSNVGWHDTNGNSGNISHMWKRHAGFDVVTWKNDTNITYKSVRHNLGKKPEIIWLKSRTGGNTAQNKWYVWHSGLTANGSLHSQYIVLDTNAAQTNSGNLWGDSGSYLNANSFAYYTGAVGSTSDVVAMLFASVAGISKVGSYNGSNSNVTLDLGFSPRFMFIKQSNGTHVWMVFDTLRGMGTGNVPHLHFNSTAASVSDRDWLDPITDGVVINTGIGSECNSNGNSYIYYAHA